MGLLKFRTFEANETVKSDYLSKDDIKELFIELLDEGFDIKFYDERTIPIGKYYITFTKVGSEGSFGYIDKGSAFGFTDIQGIKKQFNFFDILDEVKERLNSMGYTLGYNMELNLETFLNLSIDCHLQHSKWDDEDDEELGEMPGDDEEGEGDPGDDEEGEGDPDGEQDYEYDNTAGYFTRYRH